MTTPLRILSFESRRQQDANSGLFKIVYHMGKRVEAEAKNRENMLLVYITPSLKEMIGQQTYGRRWAGHIKQRLVDLEFTRRPLHIISSNLHSVVNLLYGLVDRTTGATDQHHR